MGVAIIEILNINSGNIWTEDLIYLIYIHQSSHFEKFESEPRSWVPIGSSSDYAHGQQALVGRAIAKVFKLAATRITNKIQDCDDDTPNANERSTTVLTRTVATQNDSTHKTID